MAKTQNRIIAKQNEMSKLHGKLLFLFLPVQMLMHWNQSCLVPAYPGISVIWTVKTK